MEYRNLICVKPEMVNKKPEERIVQMTKPLLDWFSQNARVLPWRENPTPYHVWVSEIMLQQTRVEAVKPYFQRFIETLPGVRELAQCEETVLLKLWEGLGYYNRVRNMQKSAQMMVEKYQGKFPADYESILALPGIGSYTAGAIASIAYHIPVPAVDGNVLRVMSRITEDYEDIAKASVKKRQEELLKKCMPKNKPGDFNQALMELGATICIPNGEPKCQNCPVASFCLAKLKRVQMELPVKSKKKARRVEEMTVFVIRNQSDEIFLHKREKTGLLAGMYEFPNARETLSEEAARAFLEMQGLQVKRMKSIEEAKHVFSHVEWHMKGYLVECEKTIDENWFQVEVVQRDIAIPSAFMAYTKYMSGYED